ncbi:MAG: hypothetical protein LW834_21240 [Cyanobium sp. 49614_E6]|jgi:hypothetical protein|nr:hypothetical protein [Cyanobium sp. 49614_E6]
MHRVTPAEGSELFAQCAKFVEACDEAIDEADALITSVVETIEWESFSLDQRASLAQWHSGVREARIALRK